MEENVIYTRELTKRFGTFTAVDRITFNVRRGEIFGFLGANGAGKTTAMRMLCGLSVPTAGEGRVAGFDIATEAEEVKKHIGYMSQRFEANRLYEPAVLALRGFEGLGELTSFRRHLRDEGEGNSPEDGRDAGRIGFRGVA